jgi:hypothetical protein
MGMNETQPPQSKNSRSIPGEVRNRNPFLISDNDEFNRTPTAYEDADLSTNFIREVTQEAGDFGRHNLLRRDFSSIDMFNSSDLIWF